VATESCPGCGVQLPKTNASAPERYHASAACWQLYGELSADTLTHDDGTFLHQHVVDTYAAQHVGETMRPIGAAFALIGLYLAVERGWTGRAVQQAHQRLAARSKDWPRFTAPRRSGGVTVADVLQMPPGTERERGMRAWSAAVWDAWREEHEQVATLVARFLDVS
jgi:Family of unknown function (DUF5946)